MTDTDDHPMIARHAPADDYLAFATTVLDLDWPATVDDFKKIAETNEWPLLSCDDDGAVIGQAWPGLTDLPWQVSFHNGELTRFWTPIGHADQPIAAAQLFTYALSKIEPVLGPALWTSSEFYVRRWQGVSGSLMLCSAQGQLRLEYIPHHSRAVVDTTHDLTLHPTWDGLTAAIAAEVGRWAQNDCMIFDFGGHCVQLIQDPDLIHVEVPDDPAEPWLSPQQQEKLAAEGWLPPEPPGWFAWHRDLRYQPGPDYCAQVTQLVIHALRDLCAVTSPETLAIKSFNVLGDEFTIGLQPEILAEARLDAAARHATVRLTEAGIAYAVAHVLPADMAVIATSRHPADHRSTPGKSATAPAADVLLWHDHADPWQRQLLVLHVVPADGEPVSKLVPRTDGEKGPHIRAEQGAGAYLRNLLERDLYVAEALASQPQLAAPIGAHLAERGLQGITCQRLTIVQDGRLRQVTFHISQDSIGAAPLRLSSTGIAP